MASETTRISRKQPSGSVGGGTVTQKDIARLAGVSPSTIYNFLHSKKFVEPETRERIDRIIEEYDYRPNASARALVRGRTDIIGIVVPYIGIQFYSQIVGAIESAVNISGYNCFICQHVDDMSKEEREVQAMRERRVDGMIIRASGRRQDAKIYEKLKQNGVPFVLIDREIKGLEDHFVGSDNIRDSREITEYLIRRGHKQIAATTWRNNDLKLDLRYRGFREALELNGIAFDERFLIDCRTEYFAGYLETMEMMKQNGSERPTAILATDATLPGVIKALSEMGMLIPDDIAIASIGGYGDGVLGALSRLRLTCAVQPCETIGREAARMLIAQMDGGNWRRGPVLCEAEIRVGNSA